MLVNFNYSNVMLLEKIDLSSVLLLYIYRATLFQIIIWVCSVTWYQTYIFCYVIYRKCIFYSAIWYQTYIFCSALWCRTMWFCLISKHRTKVADHPRKSKQKSTKLIKKLTIFTFLMVFHHRFFIHCFFFFLMIKTLWLSLFQKRSVREKNSWERKNRDWKGCKEIIKYI